MGILSKLFGKGSTKTLWSQFQYQQNDEMTLVKKAIAFTPLLMQLTSRRADEIKKRVLSSLKEEIVFIEYLMVALHLIDRHAFECFGPQRRAWFLDPLLLEVINRLVGHEGEAAVSSFQERFLIMFDSRCTAYASLDIAARSRTARWP